MSDYFQQPLTMEIPRSGKRIPIRNQARILLTNPDMLHIGIMPQHTNWDRIIRKLKIYRDR